MIRIATFAVAWPAAYFVWTFVYFKLVDPTLRRVMGADVIWTYDARQYFARGRYRRWHWGIRNAPADEVQFREFVVDMLGVVIVNVIAGAAPVATLFLLPPLAMYVCLFVAIPIYAVWWSGRYRALRA